MTETQTALNNKLAMSKALGAAFLSHQVEQLEKSVNRTSGAGNYRSKDDFSRQKTKFSTPGRRPCPPPDKPRRAPRDNGNAEGRFFHEKGSRRRSSETEKDADVIVADASLLIHGVHHLKRWCREGRQEVVVIPLEALNTLDLLKKGLTPLGSRARGASRILEAQVGANLRIRVQQDDAYVLWANLDFGDDQEGGNAVKSSSSPEWVRRVICCARWEVDNYKPHGKQDTASAKPNVILAVCTPSDAATEPSTNGKLSDPEEPLSPVPGPAPANVHISKHEQRSNGSMVTQWARRAGIPIVGFAPTQVDPLPRTNEEDDHARHRNASSRNKSRTHAWNRSSGKGSTEENMVERPPAVAAMMEVVSQPSKSIKVLARGEKLDPDT